MSQHKFKAIETSIKESLEYLKNQSEFENIDEAMIVSHLYLIILAAMNLGTWFGVTDDLILALNHFNPTEDD